VKVTRPDDEDTLRWWIGAALIMFALFLVARSVAEPAEPAEPTALEERVIKLEERVKTMQRTLDAWAEHTSGQFSFSEGMPELLVRIKHLEKCAACPFAEAK